ncbi:18577_t:CDS:1 [Funneliformis geosporum]|uniref:18380_t:CDS:1 n=1 Tax=Funneliformis geosporum TaxID=1117311 RepID=A0A9W4SP82_9GLOM|nr:18577_t:CDS:1 [Funneliformis geosporum]CAI2175829.1 18380_t:CDS:1 [Funneliformis geosporum]
MGGKVSSTNSYNWTKSRKQRSALFAKFLNIILYTKYIDLVPHSILLEDILFPTKTDNWSEQEYNIWSLLLNLLEERTSLGYINKVKIYEKTYLEMKFVNEIYDESFKDLIECLNNDYYYWKSSLKILAKNVQDDLKRSLPPSSKSDDSDDVHSTNSSSVEITLSPPKKQFGDIVPFEQVEELLNKVQLQYGIIYKKKGCKSFNKNVWIWEKSNKSSRDSKSSKTSNLNPLDL